MGYHWRGDYNKVLLIHEDSTQNEIDDGLKKGKEPVFTWRDLSKPYYNHYVMSLQHQDREGTDNKYWYGFRTIDGKTFSAYIGKVLTIEKLRKAWETIEGKAKS